MKRKGISISIHIPICVAVYVCDVAIRHTKRMSKKTVTKRFTKGKGSGKIE